MPVATFATPPSTVDGITATFEDGRVVVRWNAVEDAVLYRVYYSSRSILENGGAYDDFEETGGAVTKHVLASDSLSQKVYVSVLAVNAGGEESPVFAEETFTLRKESTLSANGVRLENFAFAPKLDDNGMLVEEEQDRTELFTVTKPTETSKEENTLFTEEGQIQQEERLSEELTTPIPARGEVDAGGKLHFLLAEALSPTEVLLTFSSFPTVDPSRAPDAFRIFDANGVELRIHSITIQEDLIAVRTDPQVRNEPYQVKLTEPLVGTNGFPLDSVNRKALFRGHEQGVDRSTGNTAVEDLSISNSHTAAQEFPSIPQRNVCNPDAVLQPPQVRDLRLRSVAQADGTHTVNARWSIDTKNCASLLRYLVRQSSDRGRTFTQPQIVLADIAGIDIPGVFPGEYGIGIAVINAQGYVSQELFQTITLPGSKRIELIQIPIKPAAPLLPPVQNTILPQPATIPPVSLPQSGVGITVGLLLAGGGTFGMKRIWRK